MELNPNSEIVIEVNKRFKADNENPMVKDVTCMLYELSLLTSGFTLEDPSGFAKRFNRMLKLGLVGDDDEEDDIPDLLEETEECSDGCCEHKGDSEDEEDDMEQVD